MATIPVILNVTYMDEEFEPETNIFSVIVPDGTDARTVSQEIKRTHEKMFDFDDEEAEDYYDNNGRNPDALLRNTCERLGWEYKRGIESAVTLDLVM